MPIISEGYVLDAGIEDSYTRILLENGSPLICTLTHIDLDENINKFCVIHALKNSSGYGIYTRSGRTGHKGKIHWKPSQNETTCINEFKKIFKKLTANIWDMTKNFEHRKGFHSVFSFGEKKPDVEISEITPKNKLTDPIDVLIDLFCGEDIIQATICSLDFDVEKMPVGQISEHNLITAKEILLEMQSNLEILPKDKIIRFSEKFYGCIPVKSGGKTPPLIDTSDLISKKLEELNDLKNLTSTLEIIREGGNVKKNLYGSINHQIRLLPSDNKLYYILKNYFYKTHGQTHSFHMRLISIYEVLNLERKEKYEKKYGTSPRKELLVHGSRLCNWRSILEKGLRINPGNMADKVTGKMFGNGIYWANSFSKSAQYCPINRGTKEKICLALGEVAVGNQLRLSTANFSLNKESLNSYDSVWGVGQWTPSKYENYEGIHVPTEYLVPSGGNSPLIYDEKIIFDEDQYHFRYLVIAEIN